MLVGQNPGGHEDVQGIPFIGPSGKLLDEMLRDAGYDTSTVYVSNAVKCKTPQNDPPNVDEIDACRVHLKAEIDRIKPKIIVALGAIALRALCKQAGITDKRGQSLPLHRYFENTEAVVVPTNHPAAIIHGSNAQLKNHIIADLRRARDATTTPEPIAFRSIEMMPSTALGQLSYDLETIDEEAKIVDEATLISVASASDVFVTQDVEGTARWLRGHPKLITHNGLEFDDDKIDVTTWHDTMLLGYLDDETQPRGLDALACKYLGIRGWKEKKFSPLGSPELTEYSARDARTTYDLHEALVEALGPRIKVHDEIIMPFHWALRDMAFRGVYVNQDRVAEAELLYSQQKADTYDAVRTLVPDREKFNPGSNQQVGEVLNSRGYLLRQTPTGKWKVDREALLAINDDFSNGVLNFRSATKMLSTYVRPYAACAQRDGRMHTLYRQLTDTGRTSSSNPKRGPLKGLGANLQNLPRIHRDFFYAQPGHALLTMDYSAIEFRLGAWLAQAHSILDRYIENPNFDPHQFFADLFLELTGIEIGRQAAKSANFSQMYVGTAATIQEYAAKNFGLHLPTHVCRSLHVAFHRIYPEFVPFYHRVKKRLWTHGFVESPTGRRRHFGDVRILNRSGRADALREAVNFYVQSITLDLAACATIEAHKSGLPLVVFGHDSISCEVPVGEVEAATEELRSCMVEKAPARLHDLFGVTIGVPIAVESKILLAA